MNDNWILSGFIEGAPPQIRRIIEYEDMLLRLWKRRDSVECHNDLLFVPILHVILSEVPPKDPWKLLDNLGSEYIYIANASMSKLGNSKYNRAFQCFKLALYCTKQANPICSPKEWEFFEEIKNSEEIIEDALRSLKECPLTSNINVEFIRVKFDEKSAMIIPLMKGKFRSVLINGKSEATVSNYTALSFGLNAKDVIIGAKVDSFKILFPIDGTNKSILLHTDFSYDFYTSILFSYVLSYLAPPHIKLSAASRIKKYIEEIKKIPDYAEKFGIPYWNARSLALIKIYSDALKLDREIKMYHSEGRDEIAWIKLYELAALFLFLFGKIPIEVFEHKNISYKLNALHQPLIRAISEATRSLIEAFPELLKNIDKVTDPRMRKAVEALKEAGGKYYIEAHPYTSVFIFLSTLLNDRGESDLGFAVDQKVIEEIEACINGAIAFAANPAEEDAPSIGYDFVFPNQFELQCGSTHNAVIELQIGNKIKFYFFDNKSWRVESAARAFVNWGKKCRAEIISKSPDGFVGELYYKGPDDDECLCLAPYIAFLSTSIDIYGCDIFYAEDIDEAIEKKEKCIEDYYNDTYYEDEEDYDEDEWEEEE